MVGWEDQGWEEGIGTGCPCVKAAPGISCICLLKRLLLNIIRFRLQIYTDPWPDPIGGS